MRFWHQPWLALTAPIIRLGASNQPFLPNQDHLMSYIEATDPSQRKTGQIKLHGASGFAGMRKAGALVARCLDELTDIVKPGVPTSEIDDFVRDFAFGHGAYPATLMYRGYRYSTCTSINHVVCHGMPGDRVLKEGDIVNIDVTFIVEGWYGDSSRMYVIGPIARKAERLIEVTYEAMMRGIAAVKPVASNGVISTGPIGHPHFAVAKADRHGMVGPPHECRRRCLQIPAINKKSPRKPKRRIITAIANGCVRAFTPPERTP